LSSLVIAGVVFACAFGGALLGIRLSGRLTDSHLDSGSKEAIRLSTGLLATLAALVLGLLVASAKSGFDAQKSGFQQLSTNIIVLDRSLGRYGPEAEQARAELRQTVIATIDHLWPAKDMPATDLDDAEISAAGAKFFAALRDLAPANDAQRTVQSQGMQLATEIARTRWSLSQPQDEASLVPFLAVLLFWLFAIFTSFGLFAPARGAVITAFLVCALSAAGAVFLIVDLSQPSGGLIHISDTALRYALAQLGK
jgi:hypothetical protein